jgi:membrane dipeptidase
MVQLTYNSVNFVAGGCTDRVDCGVTDFGVKFIQRLNDLGIIVDTGHCGRQTTLDACALSNAPVVASHTSAAGVHQHDRAKSDEELKAIAASGGYIGVYLVSMFLTDKPVSTIEDFLDHIDYIANLVGPQFIGVGSDWPMQCTQWGIDKLAEYASEIGFRKEHGTMAPVNVAGFDDYRDFPNITRGLVKRGYSDEQIKGILGENFLRVFEQVCG